MLPKYTGGSLDLRPRLAPSTTTYRAKSPIATPAMISLERLVKDWLDLDKVRVFFAERVSSCLIV